MSPRRSRNQAQRRQHSEQRRCSRLLSFLRQVLSSRIPQPRWKHNRSPYYFGRHPQWLRCTHRIANIMSMHEQAIRLLHADAKTIHFQQTTIVQRVSLTSHWLCLSSHRQPLLPCRCAFLQIAISLKGGHWDLKTQRVQTQSTIKLFFGPVGQNSQLTLPLPC